MIIAVDTGGTKTLVSSFGADGVPGDMYRFATPKGEEAYIAQLLETLYDHYDIPTVDGLVIAVPGTVVNNVAVWCENLGWQGFDVAEALSYALKCPVWLENDANLAGLAEAKSLPTPAPLSLYITVSTGIGSGFVADGQIVPGLGKSEIGHTMVEYDGLLRTWESFASGRAITETYGTYARDIHDTRIWKQIAHKLSRGLLAVIPTTQPDTIIIGGSIGSYFDQFADPLRKELDRHLPPHITRPVLRQALHPEEAVLYGCYHYGIARIAI